jgi:hypothetical protein
VIWVATSINNATESPHTEIRGPLAYTKIGFFLFVYGGEIRARQLPSTAPIMPVNPPTRTQNLSAVGSPDHGSYHRRKLSLSWENMRGCVCLSLWETLDPWLPNLGCYVGSCRRLDGTGLRKTMQNSFGVSSARARWCLESAHSHAECSAVLSKRRLGWVTQHGQVLAYKSAFYWCAARIGHVPLFSVIKK